MKKINVKKGLRRIYTVILALAIVPLLLCAFHGINYLSKKYAYEQKDKLEDRDTRELNKITKQLNMNWILMDKYLNRDSIPNRRDLEKRGLFSMGDDEFYMQVAVSMYRKKPFYEAIESDTCPSEIKDYLKLLLEYDKNYEGHPSYFSYPYEDGFALTFIILVIMIVVPPIFYGVIFGILVPFVVWIGKGFVEENSEPTSEVKTNDENP